MSDSTIKTAKELEIERLKAGVERNQERVENSACNKHASRDFTNVAGKGNSILAKGEIKAKGSAGAGAGENLDLKITPENLKITTEGLDGSVKFGGSIGRAFEKGYAEGDVDATVSAAGSYKDGKDVKTTTKESVSGNHCDPNAYKMQQQYLGESKAKLLKVEAQKDNYDTAMQQIKSTGTRENPSTIQTDNDWIFKDAVKATQTDNAGNPDPDGKCLKIEHEDVWGTSKSINCSGGLEKSLDDIISENTTSEEKSTQVASNALDDDIVTDELYDDVFEADAKKQELSNDLSIGKENDSIDLG